MFRSWVCRQHFSSVGEELAARWGQFNVSTIVDEELGSEFTLEVPDVWESDGAAM